MAHPGLWGIAGLAAALIAAGVWLNRAGQVSDPAPVREVRPERTLVQEPAAVAEPPVPVEVEPVEVEPAQEQTADLPATEPPAAAEPARDLAADPVDADPATAAPPDPPPKPEPPPRTPPAGPETQTGP